MNWLKIQRYFEGHAQSSVDGTTAATASVPQLFAYKDRSASGVDGIFAVRALVQ